MLKKLFSPKNKETGPTKKSFKGNDVAIRLNEYGDRAVQKELDNFLKGIKKASAEYGQSVETGENVDNIYANICDMKKNYLKKFPILLDINYYDTYIDEKTYPLDTDFDFKTYSKRIAVSMNDFNASIKKIDKRREGIDEDNKRLSDQLKEIDKFMAKITSSLGKMGRDTVDEIHKDRYPDNKSNNEAHDKLLESFEKIKDIKEHIEQIMKDRPPVLQSPNTASSGPRSSIAEVDSDDDTDSIISTTHRQPNRVTIEVNKHSETKNNSQIRRN